MLDLGNRGGLGFKTQRVDLKNDFQLRPVYKKDYQQNFRPKKQSLVEPAKKEPKLQKYMTKPTPSVVK